MRNVSAETHTSLYERKIWFAHAQESKHDLNVKVIQYPCNCEPLSQIGGLSLINIKYQQVHSDKPMSQCRISQL